MATTATEASSGSSSRESTGNKVTYAENTRLSSPEDNRISAYTATLYDPKSPRSPKRFRDSVHLIEPTNPQSPKRYEPLIMKLPIIIGSPLSLFILGIALEIIAGISKARDGFAISTLTISTLFGDVSAQFLASVIPTIVILPNAILWRELDWMLRSYQPFVVLQNGGAKPEESILLDYIELGPLLALPRAIKYKHRIIFLSSLTAVFTYFFQPLTGGIFQIREITQPGFWNATGLETIGLSPDINSLQPFLAAAGYVDASVLHKFHDEPDFIRNSWAISEFTFPTEPLVNATLVLETAYIQTNVNCSNPIDVPSFNRSGQTVSLRSTSVDNCSHDVAFNLTSNPVIYGVDAVPCPGEAEALDVSLRPVMFWFFRNIAGNEQAKTVFCSPTIRAGISEVDASVSSGKITKVTEIPGRAVPFNDVFNGELEGRAFNGLVFPPSENRFVSARAAALNLVIPSAILRNLTQDNAGFDAAWDRPNGVLDATSQIYTSHLTLTAKGIYFVPGNSTIRGALYSRNPRLWVDPFPAHFLAAILILTGISGIFLHVMNRRQRKRVPLAALPGTIAATVSLTSRSGWGELLTPYDNIYDMEKKLDGLRFTLDKRTGAILADDYGPEVSVQDTSTEDVKMALMGSRINPSPDPESSSFAAFQAAAGVPPWKDTTAQQPTK